MCLRGEWTWPRDIPAGFCVIGWKKRSGACCFFVRDHDFEFFLDQDDEFEGVNRIQPQAIAEDGVVVDNLGRGHLETKAVDQQFLGAFDYFASRPHLDRMLTSRFPVVQGAETMKKS